MAKVNKVFRGFITDQTFKGNVPDKKKPWPVAKQLSGNKVTSSSIEIGAELDKTGDMIWSVIEYPADPTHLEVSTGDGAVVEGSTAFTKNVFKTFTIKNLLYNTRYIFAYYTTNYVAPNSPVFQKQFITGESDFKFGDNIFDVYFEEQFE